MATTINITHSRDANGNEQIRIPTRERSVRVTSGEEVFMRFRSNVAGCVATVTQQKRRQSDPDSAFRSASVGRVFTINENDKNGGAVIDARRLPKKYDYVVTVNCREFDPVIIIEPTYFRLLKRLFVLLGVLAGVVFFARLF